MKPIIFTVFILLLSLRVNASCQVYAPVKEFNNSGYTLYFDFTKMLENKNYYEVYSPELADFIIQIKGMEVPGYLPKAVTSIEMGSFKAGQSVTCLTQFCAISDFAKSFSRAYKKLSQILPDCQ
jgi:hypothetical protein